MICLESNGESKPKDWGTIFALFPELRRDCDYGIVPYKDH